MWSFVRRRVERQLTSMTSACWPSTFSQSPGLKGLPISNAMPAMMLPSKSCIAKPTMPTTTVDPKTTPSMLCP